MFHLLKIPDPTSTPSIDYDPLSPASDSKQSKTASLITCRTSVPRLFLFFSSKIFPFRCQCDKPSKQFYSLKCGHQHCLSCWKSYLESNINPSLNRRPISCLSRCDQIIEDEQIFRLVSDLSLKQRYQRILVDAYVESNRLARWCPGNSCHVIIQLQSIIADDARMITCEECQFVFCFRCAREWHDPIQCTVLVAWEKKNQDESMNSEWLQVRKSLPPTIDRSRAEREIGLDTKPCPKCQSNIEKNGGCNHMSE